MPIGEDALSNMMTQGLEELRAANAGAMAMDAPPIEVPQTPQVEAPTGYEAAISQASAQAPSVEPDMGMSR